MFSEIKTNLLFKYNMSKVSGSKMRHVFYAIMCPFCFPFHLTVLTILLPSLIFNISNLSQSIIYCCTVPVICLLIDNLVLFLAREK